MASITTFFVGFTIIVAIALAITAATVGVWTYQFFARNRRERLAQQRPFVSYYRDLGQHAFAN
ncbi:hypothetical protein G9U51_12105 [Calidifontibacter sp. DB0510]|uniref:Uncharacterized protein n=1 Tax=Metallococcus carri TaxID=1656884 RepID=A0A967E9L7_9MICO|nr:hypothetical protein [Metallococcus carri]NHN56522.1 hypothetical protein [Metallococcus carri]NOP38821.1 hypothetical protein [Calidifontibacter sp. DB2511S]